MKMNGCNVAADKSGVRVSRQPGGSCSDIFGPAIVTEHHCRQTNNTKSTVFAPPPELSQPSPQRGRGPQEDTQNKIFGEPEALPPPVQNGDNTDGVPRVVRVRQPPGGVSSKLW